jgi:tetrahydromethanopterin S-methyltransferase subunit F
MKDPETATGYIERAEYFAKKAMAESGTMSTRYAELGMLCAFIATVKMVGELADIVKIVREEA